MFHVLRFGRPARRRSTRLHRRGPCHRPEPVPVAPRRTPPPPPPAADTGLAQALQVTRESLAALQKMQEQASNLHRQFLEGQDAAQRTRLYSQAIQRQAQLRGMIYLYHQLYYLGLRKDVAGIQYYADGLPRLGTAGFAAQ